MTTHTLRNANGMVVEVSEYGGIIRSIRVPDRTGAPGDVVLGFDSVEDYVADNRHYIGALIGRYANRIARGRFNLEGELYWLKTNQGPHHLHGGREGFDRKTWRGEPRDDGAGAVALWYTSPAGEEGYPGTLEVRVQYTITDADRLIIDYHATTDAATPVNLTQHSYFNLSGEAGSEVSDHVLAINADRFTPVDETLIPTGERQSVDGTPFDFRRPTAVGARIDEPHPQLRNGAGYDHNFVLNPGREDQPRLAARVHHPGSGRVLTVHTTEPGMQLYTGNHLDGVVGKGGASYGPRSGLALETQHFPDSPNQPDFPSTILRPGQRYRSRTVYSFATHDG